MVIELIRGSRTLFGLVKCLGVHLVDDLELGNLNIHELFAVAIIHDLGGLLDPGEVLVTAQASILGELLSHEADNLGGQLDGKAAFLVEEDLEILARSEEHTSEL